ncbi:arsenate reductase family protein [Tropicimonas sp. TH_r6]|uniref:arsenate reductase family protein n=1 Tax=Tropicimonas sp. TH_r6 TaxID=3082085 RepID=UPI00295374C4|nr:arsenate reductase family protein [Tropicimonas sp. TH_r6]MDV7144526.1 arsenate reductase family protein [Tropicimonas sp. TH_r6]
MGVTIYHNAACSKSRDVLRVIKAAGYEPEIVHYMKVGWDREGLEALLAEGDLSPRDVLRPERGPARELGLLEEGVTDGQILDAMILHPVLVERPIVRTEKGVALCRPVGKVLDLLENWPEGPFSRSNGVLLIDAQGLPVPGV